MKARSWSAIAADRPVATWMATVAIVVFGLVSLGQLPLALLPDLSYPTITVRTTFDGAAPEEVEQAVTDPIEKVVGTVENVVGVQSVSRPGVSDVTLKFRWGTRLDLASQRVRERLDVHDQRVGLGTGLRAEDLLAGGGVEGVGGEAVDGFGRSGDESARAQHASERREIAWRARVGARAEWAWANGGQSL